MNRMIIGGRFRPFAFEERLNRRKMRRKPVPEAVQMPKETIAPIPISIVVPVKSELTWVDRCKLWWRRLTGVNHGGGG